MTEQTYREHLNDLQLEVEELRAKLKEAQTGDTISRQAAIDALNALEKDGHAYVNGAFFETILRDEVKRVLEELPSAQPEIIRCKDCKFWLPHSQFGCDEDYGEYHDYCKRLVPEDEYYAFYRDADEFCSRAERGTDD